MAIWSSVPDLWSWSVPDLLWICNESADRGRIFDSGQFQICGSMAIQRAGFVDLWSNMPDLWIYGPMCRMYVQCCGSVDM